MGQLLQQLQGVGARQRRRRVRGREDGRRVEEERQAQEAYDAAQPGRGRDPEDALVAGGAQHQVRVLDAGAVGEVPAGVGVAEHGEGPGVVLGPSRGAG